jgi:hypothetical protein
LRDDLAASVGPSGFALFQTIDHGGIITALGGRPARAMTYVFGNGLIAVQMTRPVADARLQVPLRLFVLEREPGVVGVAYDVPSATLARSNRRR